MRRRTPPSPFYVNTQLGFFRTHTPRRAALAWGSAAQMLLTCTEEAPPAAAGASQSPDHFPCVVTLSAKSADALVARVDQLLNWLNPDAPIGDLCYTTNVSRRSLAAPAP